MKRFINKHDAVPPRPTQTDPQAQTTAPGALARTYCPSSRHLGSLAGRSLGWVFEAKGLAGFVSQAGGLCVGSGLPGRDLCCVVGSHKSGNSSCPLQEQSPAEASGSRYGGMERTELPSAVRLCSARAGQGAGQWNSSSSIQGSWLAANSWKRGT